MKKFLFISFICVFLIGCIPDETPLTPVELGDLQTLVAPIGTLYENQVYIGLEQNSILKQNKYTDWDLGFACLDNRFEIILNSAKFMSVVNLENALFDTVSSTTLDYVKEDLWKYDNSTGLIDSTAIGQWWNSDLTSKNFTYLINRGTDEKAKAIGYAKFKVIEFSDNSYLVQFANLKDNISYTIKILKNSDYNYVQLSLEGSGNVLELEPIKSQWEIIFTKYTQLLYTDEGEVMWYSVTGAYLNQENTQASVISTEKFKEIDAKIIDTLSFSSNRNIIGHDWKNYNFNTSSYEVDANKVFIIKTSNNKYFKLHFIDFYDGSGNKGYPKFEYEQI